MSITRGVLTQSPEAEAHDKVLDNNPDLIGIWKCWFSRREKNLSEQGREPRKKLLLLFLFFCSVCRKYSSTSHSITCPYLQISMNVSVLNQMIVTTTLCVTTLKALTHATVLMDIRVTAKPAQVNVFFFSLN